jgi:O-antigen ligase
MCLLKKIFITTLFLLVLGEAIRLDFGSGIRLKPLDIGVGITFILWIALKLTKKEKFKQKNILVPAVIFASFGAISLLINSFSLTLNQFFISLMYLVRWIAYTGVFFVVSDFDNNFKKKISKLLIIVGSVIIALGYTQYFFYPNLRNLFYLGWDEHMFRMFSVFLDPNFAGAFFVLFFLFLASIYLKRKSTTIGILTLLTLGAIFLTFSRSALIMLIMSSALLLILMNRKKWIVFLLGITILVLLISSRYFNIENINMFRIVSSEERLGTARDAVKIIQSRPFFGVGFNAYRYAQIQFGFRNDLNPGSHSDASTDNSFLFILATNGLFGIILFVFMWFRIFKLGFTSPLFVASVTGVFIDSLFINSLFYPFIMLWLWIILALSIKNQQSIQNQ